jgi:hypothetical protein
MSVIVPRPLEAALVDARHRLLPHRRGNKRLCRSGRVLRDRLYLGSSELGRVHVLERRRLHASRGANAQGAGLGRDRRRRGLDRGCAKRRVPLAVWRSECTLHVARPPGFWGNTHSKMREGFQAGASDSGNVCGTPDAWEPRTEVIVVSDCPTGELPLLSKGPTETGVRGWLV